MRVCRPKAQKVIANGTERGDKMPHKYYTKRS